MAMPRTGEFLVDLLGGGGRGAQNSRAAFRAKRPVGDRYWRLGDDRRRRCLVSCNDRPTSRGPPVARTHLSWYTIVF